MAGVEMAHRFRTRSLQAAGALTKWLTLVLALAAAFVISSCRTQELRIKSTIDEWVELFNGDDFDGWTAHYQEPDVRLEEGWRVERARLVAKGEPIGYLCSTNSFRDFVLELQWRVEPSTDEVDSGVLLRVVGEGIWPRAVEVDLGAERAGEISGLAGYPVRQVRAGRRGSRAVFPPGSWNSASVRVVDDVIQVEINGQSVSRASGVSVQYGRVGLVGNGGRVEFRNLRIRPIDINRPGRKGRRADS